MPKSVEYIRAAPKPIPKRYRPRTALEDLNAVLFRNRMRLAPFGVTFLVLVSANLMTLAPGHWAHWVCIGVPAVVSVVMLGTRAIHKVNRAVERRYVACIAVCIGTWMVLSTWTGSVPNIHYVAALIAGTFVLAQPWWRHRRVRDQGLIPVHLGDMTGAARRKALRSARSLVNAWAPAMSHAGTVGTDVVAVSFDEFSIVLEVATGQSTLLADLRKKCERLEVAVPNMRRGSARVEKGSSDKARSARIRFMYKDPHENPIKAETPVGDSHWIRVGLFETGQPVLVNLFQHLLIAGRSGAGKSTLLQIVIWAISRIPWMAMVGMDMKPGAPELGRWEKAMFKLGKNPDDARAILLALRAGLTARGDVMAEKGWQSWQPSIDQPWIVLVVDEAQGIAHAGLSDLLDEVAALLRAYGGTMVLCTQYPIKDNIPTTTKEQIVQTIGLKTKTPTADRVIFGEEAQKEGWICSKLPGDRKGSFYIESDIYDTPLLARGDYLNEDDLGMAVRTSPAGTLVDSQTWPEQPARPISGALPAGESTAGGTREMSYAEDAVLVVEEMPTDKAERVLWALGNGAVHRTEIEAMTELTQKTVDKYLGILQAQERVVKVGPAKYQLAS